MAQITVLSNLNLSQNQLLNVAIQVLATPPATPVLGQVYYNSADTTFYGWNGTSWLDLGNQGTGGTDLSFSTDGTTVTIISNTGANAVLPSATSTDAGVMSAADKNKLDGIEANAKDDQNASEVPVSPAVNTQTNVQGALEDHETRIDTVEGQSHDAVTLNAGDATQQSASLSGQEITLNQATTTTDGVMSSEDKTKLDGVEVGATADQNASEVPVTPSGNLASTDVQAALEELQTDIDAFSGGLVYKGSYNASTNTPNLESGTGVVTGDTYTVTVAGTFYTEDVEVGDVIIAEVDGASTLANWTVVNKNIPEIVDASETEKGLVEEATQAEVNAGTDVGGSGAKLFVTPSKLAAYVGGSNAAQTFTQLIGNGVATDIVVTHNLGNQYVLTQVFDASTNDVVLTEVENTSSNTVTISFNTAPSTNSYRVVIQG